MNEKKTSNILILGIGNILMGDEGVGAFVAQYLLKDPLPENVRCLDGGTGGLHLLGDMQAADVVILVDATVDGQPPGSWRILEPKFSHDYPPTLTAHDIGLKDLLDAMHLMGNAPRVILYAVSIEPLQGVGWGLSPQIEKVIPEICVSIRERVESLLQATV